METSRPRIAKSGSRGLQSPRIGMCMVLIVVTYMPNAYSIAECNWWFMVLYFRWVPSAFPVSSFSFFPGSHPSQPTSYTTYIWKHLKVCSPVYSAI